MRAVTMVLVLLASAAAVSALTNCVSPDGAYDLTGLAAAGDSQFSDPSYGYRLHFCGAVSEVSCFADNQGALCQYYPSGAFTHTLSTWDNTGTWSSCPADMCPNGGASVYFANGDQCGGSGPRRAVTYIIQCPAPGQSAQPPVIASQGCIYTVTMTHSSGCRVGAADDDTTAIAGLSRAAFIGIIAAAGAVALALLGWSIACCAKGACLCCECCHCQRSAPAHGDNALGMMTAAPGGTGTHAPVAAVVVVHRA